MTPFSIRLFSFMAFLTFSSQVLPSNELGWQRDFIARFSGAIPLADDTVLNSRSSSDQRHIAAELLADELNERGLSPQFHRYRYPNIHFVLDLMMPPFRGQNVFARIPATIKTESHVVVGAHYDSVPNGPGANDNGTGVAAVLAIAEAIAAMKERQHTFLIIFFDHEEEDGAGSKAFARKLVADGVTIHSMHNVDMVGWDGDGDRAVEVDMPTAELEALYRGAAARSGIELVSVRYNSTDHQSFRDLGIDAACVSELYASGDTTPHHHEPTDVLAEVNFDYLRSTSLFLIEAMTRLASRP